MRKVIDKNQCRSVFKYFREQLFKHAAPTGEQVKNRKCLNPKWEIKEKRCVNA